MTAHPLLDHARRSGHPVIEGQTATFLWEGKTPPALISDLHDWEENPQPLTRLAPGLWSITLELPADAYLEYAFYSQKTKQRLADPLNRRRCWNGINAYNHFFYMPEASPTPLTRRKPGAPRGTLTRHQVETRGIIAGKKRDIYLYRPPTEDPVPLLVVYDGVDYIRRGKIVPIVDNLIAQERIRPIAMALVQHAGSRLRHIEYACSDFTLGFLATIVLPFTRRQLNLLDIQRNPGAFGVLGASMGGLMSLYTALRLSQVFGRALCQSGAYELSGFEGVVIDLVRHLPVPPARFWLQCGRMDFLVKSNRKMQALLEKRGYERAYFESGGAHNYATWRDSLWRGLEYLFG